MKKKKILFLSILPPPYYGSAISSEMCLRILQNSNDFEVRNIKLNYSETMKDMGNFNFKKINGFFKTKREIKKSINNFKPDLIYFVPATAGLGLIRDFLFVKLIKRIWNGKILFHIRGRITEKDWKNLLFGKMHKKIFSEGKVIVLGEELVPDLRGMIKNKDIFILPNAIKNEIPGKKLNKILNQRKKKKSFNLLFISIIKESKGWLKLLKACKILKKGNLNFNCNFVGEFPDDSERRKFERIVKDYHLSANVKYLGRKTGTEKNKIFEKSDVLVFPTEYPLETFGRVIIEGMMFGLPVIANSIATIPSIIQDKKTGFLLKENSQEEIAEKIQILFRNKKLREKMGREGRKRFLKNYEIKSYEKKFLEVVGNALYFNEKQ